MGIFAKLRGELVDIIEWIDDSQATLVWRFPRYQNEIKNGARLIVRPGQVAVFVDQGQIADKFEPGMYELETDNLPLLSTLQGWKHGFESPFKAEVYFVSTRQLTGLKWGTPNPVMLRDADFGPVRLRAFGTYTLRAADPVALLKELVGTDGVFEAEEVSELMRSVIASAFADLIGQARIPALDLAASYERLSRELRQLVASRIDDEYGMDIPALYVVNISLPEEVEKAIDARGSMNVLGDLGSYQQYQLGKSLPTAAASEAGGGGAAAGLGLGMGLAMAGRMSGASSATTAAPPPPPAPIAWHITEAGTVHGPFAPHQIADLARQGRVTAATLVWRAGMAGWTRAAEVAELLSSFSTPPPPPPPM